MVIDTNIYSALMAGHKEIASLLNNAARIDVPLPVIAELRYGFFKGAQTVANEQRLQQFLADPIVEILIADYATTEHYAILQLHCRQKGHALSDNDLWIAALAKQHGLPLLTRDRDFVVFQNDHLGKLLKLQD